MAERESHRILSWQLNLQAQPRGCIIYLRRTDRQGRVSLLGRTFEVDRTWPYRLVRAYVDLKANQIGFYALRRRDPKWQPLLRTVPFHLTKRKFIDVHRGRKIGVRDHLTLG